ncbi:LamG domain-containing protein [Albidovulum aquaemixtae]|uniref:LamG domain-containing protein n=1 Tax=Albidovulum aquaemixtae TaxID=1542388 RepID=UPI001FE6B405|nr:LamG domain-containing protein [Defluviimonas aquaemixtae]
MMRRNSLLLITLIALLCVPAFTVQAQMSLDASGPNGGSIIAGYDSRSCSGLLTGAMRYNSSSGKVEVCASTEPTDGLIGHWQLDESAGGSTAYDSVGSNDGAWQGTGNIDTLTGQIDSAFDLEHADGNYLNLGSDTSLDNLGPLTIAAWVRPESLTDYGFGNAGTIFATTTNSGGSGYTFYVLNNGGLRFYVFSTGGTKPQSDSNSSYVATGTWTHVAATWDGNLSSAAIKIYVNGSEVSYATQTGGSGGTIDDSGNDKGIGQPPSHPSSTEFDGGIDDFRLYDRVLSNSEILSIYNGSSWANWEG